MQLNGEIDTTMEKEIVSEFNLISLNFIEKIIKICFIRKSSVISLLYSGHVFFLTLLMLIKCSQPHLGHKSKTKNSFWLAQVVSI